MTNDNAELIEEIDLILRVGGMKSEYYGTLNKVIAALESQPFDVLQHLRDGGKIVNEDGSMVVQYADKLLRLSSGESITFKNFLYSTWQPYTPEAVIEPKREPGWYWARAKSLNQTTRPWYYNGKWFSSSNDIRDSNFSALDESSFDWIGKHLIEVEYLEGKPTLYKNRQIPWYMDSGL